MAREQISLGSSPWDENCMQVGAGDHAQYMIYAERECQRYIELLTKIHGTPPGNARFQISYNPHDFGTYLWAYRVEANTPAQWDN